MLNLIYPSHLFTIPPLDPPTPLPFSPFSIPPLPPLHYPTPSAIQLSPIYPSTNPPLLTRCPRFPLPTLSSPLALPCPCLPLSSVAPTLSFQSPQSSLTAAYCRQSARGRWAVSSVHRAIALRRQRSMPPRCGQRRGPVIGRLAKQSLGLPSGGGRFFFNQGQNDLFLL